MLRQELEAGGRAHESPRHRRRRVPRRGDRAATAARGDDVRSFTRSAYPWLDELGVEQSLGDLADLRGRRAGGRGVRRRSSTSPRRPACGAATRTSSPRTSPAPRTSSPRARSTASASSSTPRRRASSTPAATSRTATSRCRTRSTSTPTTPRRRRSRRRRCWPRTARSSRRSSLRPHLIFGPGDPHLIPRVVAKAREGKLRRIGSRPIKVDVTYIDNAADAHLLAADRLDIGAPCAGKAYFISNGEPVELWAFIDRVLAEAGLPPVSRRISAWKARTGRPGARVGLLAPPPAGRAADDAVRRRADVHVALVRHLGRAPRPRLRAERCRSRRDCGDWASASARGREHSDASLRHHSLSAKIEHAYSYDALLTADTANCTAEV